MKLSALPLIAMALAGSIAIAPVAAQNRVVVQRKVVHTTNYNRARPHRTRVCTKRWVNHHKVTRCRYR